jgi:hypothetical protein
VVQVGKPQNRFTVVTVGVTGVPEGQESRVTVTSSRGDFHDDSEAACRRSGKSYTCIATSQRRTFEFHAHSEQSSTITVNAAVPAGWQDKDPDNNSTTVQVPGRRAG